MSGGFVYESNYLVAGINWGCIKGSEKTGRTWRVFHKGDPDKILGEYDSIQDVLSEAQRLDKEERGKNKNGNC